MSIGNIILDIVIFFFKSAIAILPSDLFNIQATFSNFLSGIKTDFISMINLVGLFFNVPLFLILTLIILGMPVLYLTIRLIFYIIGLIRG
jgi:hypothetical protein